MKKMLKFAIVISIILSLLGGNTAVIAAELLNDEESKIQEEQNSAETQDNSAKSTENVEDDPTNIEDEATSSEANANGIEDSDEENTSTNSQTNSSLMMINGATKEAPINNSKGGEDEPEATSSDEDETAESMPARLDVTLHLKLPNQSVSKSDFIVTLSKYQEEEKQVPLAGSSGDAKDGKFYYEFDNIPTDPNTEEGEEVETQYTLKISSKYYQNFSTTLAVKSGYITTIDIANSFDVNEKVATGADGKKLLRSVMGVGSIYGTGSAINEEDIKEMIRSIDNNENKYDLNGDKATNIIDLSYIAINKGQDSALAGVYGHDKLLAATPEATQAIFKEQNTATTEIEGNLENILKNNDQHVSLTPANPKEEITPDTPVELAINLENNEVETQEITIAPSTNPDNNIENGEAVITYTDENGEEQTITSIIGDESQRPKTKQETVAGNVKEIYKVASTSSKLYKIAEEDNLQRASQNQATIESDGTIVIDLGSKVAVKKVIIRVSGTKSKKLADIAKVEFLNGMEDRIPAPVIEAPSGLTGEAGYDSLVIWWDAMTNVTGYELEIRATIDGKEEVEYHQVDGTQITLNQFHKKDFKDNHYIPFYVRVQSVNGEWKSGFGKTITLTPEPNGPPAAPDNLFVKAGVKEITATWKNMKSTRTYNVQYRKFGGTEEDWVMVAKNLETNSITIKNLEDKVKYEVRVQGVNEKGPGPWCLAGEATTIFAEPATLPRYNAINLPKKDENGKELEGVLTEHVINATYGRGDGRSYMVDSDLDRDTATNGYKAKSALGTVDNSYVSFYQCDDWDDGGSYQASDGNKGITVEFDTSYEMNYITFAQVENSGSFPDANIYYWEEDESGKLSNIKGPIKPAQTITRTDSNGRHYYVIKLSQKIKAKKVNVQVGRRWYTSSSMKIAEIRFYNYDSLEDEVNGLFKDPMHLELVDSVDQATIDDLQRRLDTTDQNEYCPKNKETGEIPAHNGEFNPEKDTIQIELDLAQDLLNDKNALKEIIKVDTSVTTKKDSNVPFLSGLNAWQPLGVVAHANETIKVYVGNPNKKTGDSTNLCIIPTQYHAEAAYWKGNSIALKVGVNEISIPQIITSGREKGGSLYVEYIGNDSNEQYSVRVAGGEKIPVLDLSKLDRVEDKETRLEKVEKYLGEIQTQVQNLQTNHNTKHQNGDIAELDYDYDPKEEENCILGATEIVLDQMMYSVSARQILEGLKSNTAQGTDAEKLHNSLVAMEDMIELFYSHKGLTKDEFEGPLVQYPVSRLNIRYHIMFAGAAMYAGGQHIGIPYGDVPTLAKGKPIKLKEDGSYESGNYFGWGISHEIGHIINESYYVHGEVTNNYFSVLSQATDENLSVRFKYPEVYKKVTSGKTGKAQNVFTQLGLYWQFHLANDMGGYNFETYNSYQEQFDNLVFSRMDTYANQYRKNKDHKTNAPKAEGDRGVDLTLDTSVAPYEKTDNNLMRLACAATGKNVLTFFEKWGMEPDADTIKYAEQFEKIYEDESKQKEKAIWYINDEARAYQLAEKPRMSENTTVKATVETGKDEAGVEIKNQKVLTLETENNEVPEAILGYEINRISWAYGEEIVTPVGFITPDQLQTGNKFTDTIESINNRVFEYRIVAYDKYLNSTKDYKTEQFKVEHDGNIGNKSDWEISTNFLTAEEQKDLNNKNTQANKNNAAKSNCSASENETNGEIDAITAKALIDGNYDTDFEASNSNGGQITISLPEDTNIVGLRYKTVSKKEIANFTVEVSSDGTNWETVTHEKTNLVSRIFNAKLENGTATVYFNPDGTDKLCVYNARYVRLNIKDKDIAIAEIDLLGQTGDNIDFNKNADTGKYEGIGMLANDVSLGTNSEGVEQTIPQGSIVFTGTYKGNPAYNTPVLYDDKGNPIESYGAIFAEPLKEGAKLDDVVGGIWIYWIEPGDKDSDKPEKVKDYEIYQKTLKAIKDKELKYVRAELYRTDDAMTLEGERLTSDTYLVEIPIDEQGNLPNVEVKR